MTVDLLADVEELGHAKPVTGLDPGTEAWQKAMTASKVPTILGVNPYGETRYQLWHQLAGNYTPTFKGNSATDRGTALEAGVAQWWNMDHPEATMTYAGTWQSTSDPRFYATPDYFIDVGDGPELLEIKTSSHMSGFGDPALGVIPDNYWAQLAWQSIVTGIMKARLSVLGPFLERTDYVITFDSFVHSSVLSEVTGFLDTLPGGKSQWEPIPENPETDWSAALAVTPVVKDEADVSGLYGDYASAKREGREMEKRAESIRRRMITSGADAKVLVAGGAKVATRTKTGSFRFSPVD